MNRSRQAEPRAARALLSAILLLACAMPLRAASGADLWPLYGKHSGNLSHRSFTHAYCLPCHEQPGPLEVNFQRILSDFSEAELRAFLIGQLQWMPPDPLLRRALQSKLEALTTGVTPR